jgi:hypothetical protein
MRIDSDLLVTGPGTLVAEGILVFRDNRAVEGFRVKLILFALTLLGTGCAYSQQLSCAALNDQPGAVSPQYTMKGCSSFNELYAAIGLKLTKGKEIKSYACFATTSPAEGLDLFIVASIGGVMDFGKDKPYNGMASMETFYQGVKINDAFADMIWTQYPMNDPFLWSDGIWLGHGETQMMSWDDAAKELVAKADSASKLKSMHLPHLYASVKTTPLN